MQKTMRALLAVISMLAGANAFAVDTSGCLGCHDREEFDGMQSEEVSAAIKNSGGKAHRKFEKLSDEEILAISDALTS